eukprot:scaffold935_cov248-Pinguiococcus_pyrenoidosus.AAC.23
MVAIAGAAECSLHRAGNANPCICRLLAAPGLAKSIPFYQESFDIVIFHTTLMHISPGKKRNKVMQEAARV